jgi:hypothetical protein
MGLGISKDIGAIISIAAGIEGAASSVVAGISCLAFLQQDLRWLKMLLFHVGVENAAGLLAISLFKEGISFSNNRSIYAKARLAYLWCSLIAAAAFAYSRLPKEPLSIEEIERDIRATNNRFISSPITKVIGV